MPSILQDKASGYEIDYKQSLLIGASAGGYYAAQLATSHPDEISALALAYPAVDLRDEMWTKGPAAGAPTVFRFPLEEMPSTEDTLAWVEERREKVVSKGGFEATPYLVALTQNVLFASEMLEHNGVKLQPQQLPLERLRTGAMLPKAV